MTLREWNARLHGLVVFRALLEDPVVAKLVDLTDRMASGRSWLSCPVGKRGSWTLPPHIPSG